MSKRESLLYIVDILDSIDAIEEYLENTNYEIFCNDRKTYAAKQEIDEVKNIMIQLKETSARQPL